MEPTLSKTTHPNGNSETLNRRVRNTLRKATSQIAYSYYVVERILTYTAVPNSLPVRYVSRAKAVTVKCSRSSGVAISPQIDQERGEKMEAALAALQEAGFEVEVERFDDRYREGLRGQIAFIIIPTEHA